MENRQIKELMAAMGRSGIKRVHIKKHDWEVEIERDPVGAPELVREVVPQEAKEVSASRPKQTLAHESRAPDSSKPTKINDEEVEQAHAAFVTSPMVGVFYPTPSPEDPPFVKVGETVASETVVCIVEAMKVMNEVKAGVSGVVEEVMVEHGHPVEFGTKLFKINPNGG